MRRPSPGNGPGVPGSDPRSGLLRPPLLVVCGPTGTGKTEVAIELARELDGEIVGCDALQVYRGLDAATAKPDREQRSAVPHHLVDEIDPGIPFTLADWVGRAETVIDGIARRGRLAIVVGGTGMYLRGLLRGVVDAPSRDPALRARLERLARRHGAEALWRVLRRADPASAARLAPADRQRVVRALEILRAGGEGFDRLIERRGTWRAGDERYPNVKYLLHVDPARLAERLDARVARFFASGLVDEVRGLLDGGVPASANAFRAIGYREVIAALDADRDPSEAAEEVCRNTRRLAKRQRTWFRSEPGTVTVAADRPHAETAREVLDHWRTHAPRKARE